MRKSKYLDKIFGTWKCTHVGVARVQPKFKKNHKGIAKRHGHQSYYYLFERITSDNKATKQIRLNQSEAAKVYKGLITVEAIADLREEKFDLGSTTRINYHNLRA